jgi:hypothetical protein
MNTSEIRSRTVAVLVGIALLVLVAILSGRWIGNALTYLFLFDLGVYGVAGFVLGFVWPKSGWRLGLYLSACWLPMLLAGLFLAWEQPVTGRMTLTSLLGYLPILIGACVGSGLGSRVRRATSKPSANVSHT